MVRLMALQPVTEEAWQGAAEGGGGETAAVQGMEWVGQTTAWRETEVVGRTAVDDEVKKLALQPQSLWTLGRQE